MIPNSSYPDTGESGDAYDVEQHSLPLAVEKHILDDMQRRATPITRE
ncbi:MAG TPA: hypothetical protein VGA05_08660 [Candidatus Bathyarchaeia archaeon]